MSGENAKRHPGTAAVLSFIFSGLGELYNGQIAKGLIIMLFSVISMLLLIFGSILIGLRLMGEISITSALTWGIVLFLAGFVFICILGIYSIVNSYRTAAEK